MIDLPENATAATEVDVPRRHLLRMAGTVATATVVGLGSAAANTMKPVSLSGPTHPDGRFSDEVVLITGATYGIGQTTAEAFAREGAKVAFCGRTEDLGRKVEAGIKEAGGKALYIRADVRDPVQVERFVDETVQHYGRIDVAFNNAGCSCRHWRSKTSPSSNTATSFRPISTASSTQ